MRVYLKLHLDIPKEVCKSLEVDNYTNEDIEINLKCEKKPILYVKTRSIGSLKSILDDFFRCQNAAMEVYNLIKTYTIRNVTKDDLDDFLELYYKAYRGFDKYYYKKKKWVRWYFKWLMKRDEDGFFVCEINGKPIGFIACDCNWISNIEKREVAEIHEIFVDPDFRGRGIGTALINKAIEYAKKNGRNIVELWVGVENKNAIEFYKKLGFEKKEIVKEWLRMVKRI
ncbi:GCN5-related N-acetyltransferase [Methanocaldococcus bathoardescens]|uniref:GCN5-related N-acetyltransferase n=1 Tax=Methanocaldococcus bathoardescens TaxID=1301915 RepID=A0A076LF71_9EURY|nr:KEOPS complex subunit Pcc1 [Methanocaldococcus bathoardescens]AIJ05482.1 GCN5-related N-acetyltransferase [Methanocaldococcus bathoardescens]